MPYTSYTKRKLNHFSADESYIAKGIAFNSKKRTICSITFGLDGNLYKMCGFPDYSKAKLARLNLLIVFKPMAAAAEINTLIDSKNLLISWELKNMLPTLLQEAQGKIPERVKIKTAILKPLFAIVGTKRFTGIRNAQYYFELANKEADKCIQRVAPLMFSPTPRNTPIFCQSPQITDIPEAPDDLLNFIYETELPNRAVTLSRFSFESEFPELKKTPELIETPAKRVRLDIN